MEERSGGGPIKKVAHMTDGYYRAVDLAPNYWQKSFEELFHRTHPSSSTKPLRALALPFIKTRPLVPKKFENSKKAHIAPSQRLVAKVHPSHTSLSKGILFFVSSKKKVRIHCLCLRAQRHSSSRRLYASIHTSPAAAKVVRHREPSFAYPERQPQTSVFLS